jgi:hypothetical protein
MHHQYWDVGGCIKTRSDQVLEEGIRRPCPGSRQAANVGKHPDGNNVEVVNHHGWVPEAA